MSDFPLFLPGPQAMRLPPAGLSVRSTNRLVPTSRRSCLPTSPIRSRDSEGQRPQCFSRPDRSRATSKSYPMKPPRLLDQDSSGGVQGPGVGERHKAASKPLIQSGPKSAAGRSRATSKSLPMGYPYFDITNERAQPCQNAPGTPRRGPGGGDGLVLEDHSGGYRIEPIRPGGVLVGFRPFEERRDEFRPGEVRPGEVREERRTKAIISLLERQAGKKRIGRSRWVSRSRERNGFH